LRWRFPLRRICWIFAYGAKWRHRPYCTVSERGKWNRWLRLVSLWLIYPFSALFS
jgi:hypothetical protein